MDLLLTRSDIKKVNLSSRDLLVVHRQPLGSQDFTESRRSCFQCTKARGDQESHAAPVLEPIGSAIRTSNRLRNISISCSEARSVNLFLHGEFRRIIPLLWVSIMRAW